MVNLTLATYNVRGLSDSIKRRRIFNHIHHKNYDIVLLQETHSTKSSQKRWKTEYGGNIIFNHGESNARGVAILFAKSLQYKIIDVNRDIDRRVLVVKIEIEVHKFQIINCYAPNTDDDMFFRNLNNISVIDPNFHQIIAGDFNTILTDLDVKGGKNLHPRTTSVINSMIEQYSLTDIWRARNPESFRFTWAKKFPPLYKRLDFILVSSDLQIKIKSVDIEPAFLSDHATPMILIVIDEPPARGRGYWKLNNSLLQDENYITQMKQVIKDTLGTYQDSILSWEMLKLNVKGETIKYSVRKKKADNNAIEVLERKLKQATVEQSNLSLFDMQNRHRHVALLQKDLEALISKRTEGAIFKTKSEWYDGGEKMTKYFFGLENFKARKKVITKIKDSHGNLKTETQEILTVIARFYGKLFNKQNTECDPTYLDNIDIPTIRQEDFPVLNDPIMLEEVKIAINQLADDKCPGIDGFSANWYKKFSSDICHALHSVILANIENGKMHGTSRESITSLMDKNNQNLLELQSWRPLSILNNDYKVYAKILANRLQYVTPYLISSDQFGFLKGRHMTDNLLELAMVIDYCQQVDRPALITAIDFRKAFDTVSWTAMKNILHKFGLGKNFIKMLMVCFNDFKTRILNNGHMSDYITITRGTKQGCPISSIIFNFIVEIIGLNLKQNTKIKSISIGNKTKTVGQFADDLWTAMWYDRESFDEQNRLLKLFRLYTGLQVNYDKTEVLRIGSLKGTDAQFYTTLPIKWSDGPIRVLGTQITGDTTEMMKINYQILIDKVDQIFNAWTKRSLTMLGRKQIINTLIVPHVLARIMCLPSPTNDMLQTLKSKTNQFLWAHKKARIAYDKLTKPFIEGGIGLIDYQARDQSIKASLLYRILQQRHNSFLESAVMYFTKIPHDLILKVNLSQRRSQAY